MKRNYYTFAFLMVISLQFACSLQPAHIPVSAAKCKLVNALFTDSFLRHNVDSWMPMISTGKPR